MAFCSNCGAQIPDGAAFCPKCGMEIGVQAKNDDGAHDNVPDWDMDRHARHRMRREMRQGGWGSYMSPEYRLAEAITGGLIVILLGGLLFLAAYQASTGIGLITWSNFWAYLIAGVGVIFVLKYFVGVLMPGHWYNNSGGLIWGIILIAIGSLFIVGWSVTLWPLIIVAAGVLVIGAGVLNYMTKRPM